MALGGLRPVGTFGHPFYQGRTRMYKKEASVAMAPGDFVIATGTCSTVDPSFPLVTIGVGSEGSKSTAIAGVVVGIVPNYNDLTKKSFAAADTGFVLVDVDPRTIYEVAEDGVAGYMAVTAVGGGVDMIWATFDTLTQRSNVLIDSSTIGTSGQQLKLLELVQGPGVVVGDSTARWHVMINAHEFASTSQNQLI